MVSMKDKMRFTILEKIGQNTELLQTSQSITFDKQDYINKLIEEYERSIFGNEDKLTVLDKLTLDLVKYKAHQISKVKLVEKNKRMSTIPSDLAVNSMFDE